MVKVEDQCLELEVQGGLFLQSLGWAGGTLWWLYLPPFYGSLGHSMFQPSLDNSLLSLEPRQ